MTSTILELPKGKTDKIESVQHSGNHITCKVLQGKVEITVNNEGEMNGPFNLSLAPGEMDAIEFNTDKLNGSWTVIIRGTGDGLNQCQWDY